MRNKGITLVALIVTIIVLLILAGVSLSILTGDNGIITKAIAARTESQRASAVEKLNLKIQGLIASKDGFAKLVDLNEFTNESSSNYDKDITLESQVQEVDIEAIIKMDGYTFTIDNLLKISKIDGEYVEGVTLPINTAETNQGTQVQLPDGWGTTATRNISTANGLEVSSVKVSSVYAVAVGDGVSVPVPYGFYYVGGNLNTGVIISDNENDSYTKYNLDRSGYTYVLNATTNHLLGNQFVFIPCDESNYKKTSWGLQNANWDTTVQESEITQIQKYGGFYVARYEAGLATTISEFTAAQNNTGSQVYNKSGMPQSKAEQIPWTLIDWTTAKLNAANMYNTDYVNSGLITGTQWDIVLNTMINKLGMTTSDMTNSLNWGNYGNDSLSFSGTSSIYVSGTAYQYPFGNTSVTGNYLYKTGESQSSMKYGISDFAGNIWEWTEEVSFYGGNTSTQYRELRSGSFTNDANASPVCYRLGSRYATETITNVGFRVALYMK